jgi:hypothetical protein
MKEMREKRGVTKEKFERACKEVLFGDTYEQDYMKNVNWEVRMCL